MELLNLSDFESAPNFGEYILCLAAVHTLVIEYFDHITGDVMVKNVKNLNKNIYPHHRLAEVIVLTDLDTKQEFSFFPSNVIIIHESNSKNN